MAIKTYEGGCHCGALTYSVDLDLDAGGSRCNCSVCQKLGYFGASGKPEALRVTAGEAAAGMYEWASKSMQRYFCKTCGVHCFGRGYLEELGGAFMNVNVNTLEGVDPSLVGSVYWDGRHNNWQAGPRQTPWPIAG